MLTKCPECDLPVSDKAISCPHCGYPLKNESTSKRRKPAKRRRLPNGFGQISELKGMNLRKPFRAMVTIGKDDEGKPVSRLLQPEAYFETYNDAYQALMEYNKNPYVFQNALTVGELYEKWSSKFFEEAGKAVIESTRSAWRYCKDIEKLKVTELRPKHILYCMDEVKIDRKGVIKTATPQIKDRIKITFNKMLDYAVAYDLVDKNCSRGFKMSMLINSKDDPDVRHHIPYTDKEMKLLWENIYKYEGIDVILIQCYSGWRPKEMELLRLDNVDLDKGIMIGGMKTKAGTNRTVPIHSKIYDLVKKRYNESVKADSEYLFTGKTVFSSGKVKYHRYRYTDFWEDMKFIVETLGLNPEHKPHDGRDHFVTQAKKYELNEYAIKYIVGHTITDITESVYTTRSDEWLKSEIEKIK